MRSVEEVAESLRVTPGRVYQLLASGQLVGKKLHRNAWVVSGQEVERYLASLGGPAGYVTVAQAAAILGLDQSTVRYHASRGRLRIGRGPRGLVVCCRSIEQFRRHD